MKHALIIYLFQILLVTAQAQSTWKDFEYTAPASYKLVDKTNRLVLEKFVGKQYCQLVIFPLEKTSADAAPCFKAQWDFFARNAEQGAGDAETKETESLDGWIISFEAAKGNLWGRCLQYLQLQVINSGRSSSRYQFKFLRAARRFSVPGYFLPKNKEQR